MAATFDIFRVQDGDVLWLQSTLDLHAAQQRIRELGANAPGEYLIYDYSAGCKISMRIPEPEIAGARPAGDLLSTAESIVLRATSLAEADFGNLQIVDAASNSLRIVAQSGLSPEFMRFFETVSDSATACSEALKRRARVVVKDVAHDPLYSPACRDALLAEGIQSVQSVPLLVDSKVVGVISQHYRAPEPPDDVHLRISDSLAAQFAQQVADVVPA